MNIKNMLTPLVVTILSTSAVYAQKVEATLLDGHPVINCEGMPFSAYTTTPKGNTEAVLKTEAANEKVYKRFSVYKSDNSSRSYWPNSFTVCRNVSGGGWRLPTQREMMLMWVLKSELERTSGFAPFYKGAYWCAMESSESSKAWFLDFNTSSGTVNIYIKNHYLIVRCIKEL